MLCEKLQEDDLPLHAGTRDSINDTILDVLCFMFSDAVYVLQSPASFVPLCVCVAPVSRYPLYHYVLLYRVLASNQTRPVEEMILIHQLSILM